MWPKMGRGPLAVVLALPLMACSGSNPSSNSPSKADAANGGSAAAGAHGGADATREADASRMDASGGVAPPARACELAPDCDTVPATAGQICDNLACRPCANNRECQRIPYYGEAAVCTDGRCGLVDPCTEVRGARCECGPTLTCADGLICGEDGKCVADPCTLPGAAGGEHCPCLPAPGECKPGFQCAAATTSCEACTGAVGCACPCEGDLVCGAAGRCEAQGCEPGTRDCACADGGAPCAEGLFCREALCQPCDGGQVAGCPCVAGACQGLVCDSNTCRAARTCADIQRDAPCLPHEACVDADTTNDAHCGDCDLGYVRQGADCVVRIGHPPVCDPASPDDISVRCRDDQHRDCAPGPDGVPACAGCLPGYLLEDGVCRTRLDCDTAGCTAAHRACNDAPPSDATCLGCDLGYQLSAGCAGADCICEPIVGLRCDGPDGIRADCALAHQGCDDADGSAGCTGCEDGYFFDAGRAACRIPVACAQLPVPCEPLNRPCIEHTAVADAHCDFERCVAGYVAPPGGGDVCVLQATCDPSPCPAGQFCRIENNAPVCGARPCPGGQAQDPRTGMCVGCSLDQCPPDDARTGNVAPILVGGNCICETRANHFWRTGNGADAIACDEDRDGWVSQSAFAATQSPDLNLREQAHCDVRRVDRFVLRPEQGPEIVIQTQAEFGTAFVPLVETDRNDRQLEFNASAAADHPNYANPPAFGGRQMRVEELNPLTKLCVDERADFNDDGSPDVAQGQNDPPGNHLQDAVANAMAARLSYFAELHVAFYVAPAAGESYGKYVIAERSRQADAPANDGVAMSMDPAAGDFWRSCHRFVDTAVNLVRNGDPKVTFDFAGRWDSVERQGMVHHSQFKCLDVVRRDRPELLGNTERLHMVSNAVAAQRYTFQACTAGQAGGAVASGANPVNPTNVAFQCDRLMGNDRSFELDGFVAWAVVPYDPYGGTPTVLCTDALGQDDDSRCPAGVRCSRGYCQYPTYLEPYTRGCINECEELSWLGAQAADQPRLSLDCPQYDPTDTNRMACGVATVPGASVPDSGKLVCCCILNYGGELCDESCATPDVLVESPVAAPFDIATRAGSWLCLSGNAGDGEPLTGPGGASLSLKLSESAVNRTTFIEGVSADGATTYRIY